jgi:hypothetical protein
MSKDLKVTDKRIFTPEGELREEFRHLQDQEAASEPPRPPAPEPAAPPAAPAPAAGARAERVEERGRRREPEPAPPPPAVEDFEYEPEPGPRLELPGTPPGFGAPTFYDLIAMMAEPVALYLGDAQLPDGQSAENLEMARLHIDLLDVLRQKTAGNLTAQESAVLEDILYRLRLRYVQKRG